MVFFVSSPGGAGTTLEVSGTALEGFGRESGGIVTPNSGTGILVYAAQMAAGSDPVGPLWVVCVKELKPVTASGLGAFWEFPTLMEHDDYSDDVTHVNDTFCRSKRNGVYSLSRIDMYGTSFVATGADSGVFYPMFKTLNGRPVWRLYYAQGNYRYLYYDNRANWGDRWFISSRLGSIPNAGPTSYDPENVSGTYVSASSLPGADGQTCTFSDGTNTVTLQYYRPRWESTAGFGEYSPVGSIAGRAENASGTVIFGVPQFLDDTEHTGTWTRSVDGMRAGTSARTSRTRRHPACSRSPWCKSPV